MRRWLPSLSIVAPVTWPVHILQPSSDGQTWYPTTVWPSRLSCPCRGFGFRQSCRHSEDTRSEIRELLA